MSVFGHMAAPELGRMSSLLDPWAVRAAATLRLPDLVADGADTTAELARRSGTDPDALGRLMRHLRLLGLFTATTDGRWRLTRLGEQLRDGHPTQLRRTLDQDDAYLQKVDQSGHGLLAAVRTGGPVWEETHGLEFWDDLARHPELGSGFDRKMERHSATFGPAIARGHDWSSARQVVDVGGGTGRVLAAVLSAHPQLGGTLVDLPGTVGHAGPVLREAGVADRCAVVPQSFFDPLPPGGDVYLLVNVVHNWGDEASVKILRRCADAAGTGGRILLAERILTEHASDTEQAFVSGTDLYMLMLIGGKERTTEEFGLLGTGAGLRLAATHALPDCPWLSLVEYTVEN